MRSRLLATLALLAVGIAVLVANLDRRPDTTAVHPEVVPRSSDVEVAPDRAERQEVSASVPEAPTPVSPESPTGTSDLTVRSVGGRVVGWLLDVNGRAVDSIDLAIRPNGDNERALPALNVRRTTSDSSGFFEFRRLAAGPWTLYTLGKSAMRVPIQRVDVVVRDGETTEAFFKDFGSSAVRVSGRVIRNGEPLPAGWPIHVASVDPVLGFGRSATVDSNGRFEITVDQGGDYQLRLRLGGGLGKASAIFAVTIPQVPAHELELAFVTGSLAGSVFGPGGARIEATIAALGESMDPRMTVLCTAQTDDEGHYEMRGVPAGTYRFSIRTVWGTGLAEKVTVPARTAITADLDVHWTSGGRIQGRTMDAEGRPIADADVVIRDCFGGILMPSSSTGRFMTGVPAGECWLRATQGELTSSWTCVSAVEGSVTEVHLRLAPGAEIIVEIEGAAGPSPYVLLRSGAESTDRQIRITNGMGVAHAVPPGIYGVVARRDSFGRDGPTVEATLTVLSGEKHTLRLRLTERDE